MGQRTFDAYRKPVDTPLPGVFPDDVMVNMRFRIVASVRGTTRDRSIPLTQWAKPFQTHATSLYWE